MSQVAESGAPDGTLGKKNLTTMHAVAQALAIGPMFSVALILGGVSRPDIGAGWNAALAVLFAGLGVVAIAYTISLYARKYAGAGAVYEYLTHGAHPWVGVFTAGFFFVGALFLGGGGIYLGLGILTDGFWTTHISDSGPAWWVWGAIALGIVLVLNYFGVRLAIRAMLTFAAVSFIPMVILAFVIIVKGGENGNTLTMFNPGETSLFGITGGGVLGGILLGILLFVGFEAAASIGEESEDPHRSIPRALIGTVAVAAAFFVLMAYAFSIGYGKVAVSEGKWASSPSAVSEMATIYVGKWFATILELVVILDAMALALAICVMIGRGFFALGRDGLLPSVLRQDVDARHAVGREPDGRGRRHRPLPARELQDYGTQFGFGGGRPVRDVHLLRHRWLLRDRARLSRPRPGGVPSRRAEREQAVAVPDRRRRGDHADSRLLRRAQPGAAQQRQLQLGCGGVDDRPHRPHRDLVRDRRPDAPRQGRQRSDACGRAPRRRSARRDARLRVRRRDHAALDSGPL